MLDKELFELQDLKYKEFHQKLMPTVNSDKVIGIRTPVLRKFAKEFSKREEAKSFLKNLPHKYYEEDNLHAFLLEEIKNYETLIQELNKFLPFVDNWATCDMMRPKILRNHKTALLGDIKKWLDSEDTYTIRFAVNCLMNQFLEEDKKKSLFKKNKFFNFFPKKKYTLKNGSCNCHFKNCCCFFVG